MGEMIYKIHVEKHGKTIGKKTNKQTNKQKQQTNKQKQKTKNVHEHDEYTKKRLTKKNVQYNRFTMTKFDLLL